MPKPPSRQTAIRAYKDTFDKTPDEDIVGGDPKARLRAMIYLGGIERECEATMQHVLLQGIFDAIDFDPDTAL